MAIEPARAPRRERSWPRGHVDLLLKALLSPEPQARAAWQEWTLTRVFDEVGWREMRLLAPLARRLAVLDPASPLRPRIDGLAKNLWTQTQLKLRETVGVFDRFAAAGIPLLVFKGAAQTAEGLRASNRRIMGDVDILVHRDDVLKALDALEADGWSAVNGESFDYLHGVANVRLSGNFKKGKGGEIDLHTSPFHFARIDPVLDRELWSRARPAKLALRDILVPDPTDAVLLLLAHSATSDNGDWAVDLAARIDEQAIDWERLAAIAARRGLVPACRAGLRYLAEALDIAVPAAALGALSRKRVPFAERLKYWSSVRDRSDRNLLEKAANRVADRLLRRRGFDLIVKDRHAVTVTRPNLRLWIPGRRLIRIDASSPLAVLQHRLDLPAIDRPRRLLIDIEIVRPSLSRRVFFDVSVDGIGIARLRSRAGGRDAGRPKQLRFDIKLPEITLGGVSLLIDARPVRFMPPDTAADALADIEPLPFRVMAAWVYLIS